MAAFGRAWLPVAIVLGLAGFATAGRCAEREPIKFPDTQYEPVEWASLDGWATDDHATAFATFLESCRALNGSRQPSAESTTIADALRAVCVRAVSAVPLEEDGARKFFEDNFRPLRISKLGDSDGFLTGYYEPIIEGSRVPTGEFTAPLYRRPPNLAIAGRRKLGDAFPSKGVKVGRRVGRRKLVPYYDRGQIEDGALDGWHLEICWLRSEVDVLFAQIQGSARIRLEDGTILRVNYDSHNGWSYTAVGRALIERKIFTKDELSMQRIRDWMTANPDEAKEVRRTNKSYVFFRITALGPQDEAVGGQGVPLVPGRSIAIDRALHAYGTPFFIAADLPIANEKNGIKFRRLMVGQDTGSAIVGPARADIYFGAGVEAGSMAGRIKNPGRFVMLMPRELDPVEAGQNVRLPPDRRGLLAQLGAGNMIDPTAEEVPLPEPRPATAPSAESQSGVENLARAMSRRRSLSDEERALWTGVARSIKPLRPSHRAAEVLEPTQSAKVSIKVPAKPPPKAETSAPLREARPENVPEKKTPALAPLGRRFKQRVARGREPIDARLDLHGLTQTQAHAALLRFLRRAQTDGVRMVLVVTGKGTSKGGDTHERGVLKRQVPLWLSLPAFRSLVVGFEDAHVGHGGAGALYVRLRRAQRSGD